MKKRHIFALALLAVFTVAFGLAGTVAPISEPASPQQLSSSPSVTHFVNPPTFNSGWIDITDKAGQSFSITHDLNTTDALVDVVGRQSLTSVEHKMLLGSTVYIPLHVNRTYGGVAYDRAYSLVRTSDGGYALAGYTVSYGADGSADFWLVKVNSDLNVEWNQTYGGGGESAEHAYSLVQTSDGGYALAGFVVYGVGDDDFWVVRTDSAGNMLWNRTFGGPRDDVCNAVIETNDGGFALVGYTYSFGAGRGDFWLVKTDSDGNHLWNRTYGGNEDDVAYSLVQTTDGGYALAGDTNSSGAGNFDSWLVKTDGAGNWLWGRTHGGPARDEARSLIQTSDGGYAIAGNTRSFGVASSDFWLVKTDSLGFLQWNQTYGIAARTEAAYSLIQTSDGGYALTGYTSTYSGDIWLVKTDSNGIWSWDQKYGTIVSDSGRSLVETGDGGYAIAGSTEAWSSGGFDFWLVKTGVGELGSSMGLSMTGFTNSTITLYRGSDDPFWNYIRVRIWVIEEPTWMFGDINQDGVVDAQDLLILSQNYGGTLSLLSLGGIVGILGLQTYKARKRPE